MMLLAGFSNIDSSPPALPDASQRAVDRNREPRNQAWWMRGVIEVHMPKTEEAKKNAITVKFDHLLVSRVSSQERSSRHG